MSPNARSQPTISSPHVYTPLQHIISLSPLVSTPSQQPFRVPASPVVCRQPSDFLPPTSLLERDTKEIYVPQSIPNSKFRCSKCYEQANEGKRMKRCETCHHYCSVKDHHGSVGPCVNKEDGSIECLDLSTCPTYGTKVHEDKKKFLGRLKKRKQQQNSVSAVNKAKEELGIDTSTNLKEYWSQRFSINNQKKRVLKKQKKDGRYHFNKLKESFSSVANLHNISLEQLEEETKLAMEVKDSMENIVKIMELSLIHI
eukprot:TRINITY_DN2764_c0_g1_i1.p1 TRINITY_DN2764_c0_g1~~TRINITY_DN2764_c0_g1_i1.p1  ORF type:complete len:297 (-),score=35.73 TRINITY_DN2764_c0_g1_i1:2-769(-)